MSKKSRIQNKEKRLQAKRAKKAGNKARYAEMKRLGINGKSKRFLKGGKVRKHPNAIDHPNGDCGNTGCMKCFPELQMIDKKLN